MTEEGTLSIMRRGNTYQVRYASNNPSAVDREPYHCASEAQVGTLLHSLQIDPWYITQAGTDLRERGFAGIPVVLEEGQLRAIFLPLVPVSAYDKPSREGKRPVYAA